MEYIFYIFCFFPFVKWFGIGGSSDVQVYCLLFSVAYLFYYIMKRPIRFTKRILRFYGWIVASVIITIMVTIAKSGFDMSTNLRYLATYIGMVCISYVSYLICGVHKGISETTLKVIINIYLLVGIIQKFLYREFAYGIVANARTTSNRGVVGLCSEPSFYGYMCVFLLILVLDFKKNQIFYAINLLFQIVLVAKSSITILYLLIFAGLYLLFSMNRISARKLAIVIAGVILVAGLGYYYVTSKQSGQRIAYFIQTIITERNLKQIAKALSRDYSVYVRFTDIWTCIKGFAQDFGMPYGFNTRKISSGYGSLIYTMGVLGVTIIAYIFMWFRDAFDSVKLKRTIPVFIFIIMFSAIQLANPAFSFLIGYAMYKTYNKGREEIEGSGNNITFGE